MTHFRHKNFLKWLLYAIVAAFTWIAGFYAGIPQMALSYDTTYMCAALMLVYGMSEVYMGMLAWRTSRELESVGSGRWHPNDSVLDLVFERNSFGYFVGEQAILVGLLGTFYGIIEAFRPFFGMHGIDITSLQDHIGDFFTGLAIAIFPSAVAIAVKVFLDVSSRILMGATHELVARSK